MVKKVIKKGGRIEKFQKEKIENSLKKAIERTGLKPEEKKRIFEKTIEELNKFLAKKSKITTAEIEAKILLVLDNLSFEVSKVWREYRREKKKRE